MKRVCTSRPELPISALCDALSVSRASLYRHHAAETPEPGSAPAPARPQPRALSSEERSRVLEVLTCERFADEAPRQVYAQLLDEGQYLCSVRTMYRILEQEVMVRERRDVARHPVYTKPELLARRPNEVWSWDITKLLGPVKWTYFYLYVVLDIFSRYVVGWMVAERESAPLAEQLIEQSCERQQIVPGQLTIHADRGSSMKSGLVAQLLLDLGVTKTHSRPQVSNDNPFSESQFKTMKYRPRFPGRFGSRQDAQTFCREFFGWYNEQHRHSGIGLHTPETVHYGRVKAIDAVRREALRSAYESHPERFVRKQPEPPAVPPAVWINPPKSLPGNASGADPARQLIHAVAVSNR